MTHCWCWLTLTPARSAACLAAATAAWGRCRAKKEATTAVATDASGECFSVEG